MKTFYTSNYARNGNDSMAIAVSKRPPDWYTGKMEVSLAPTWEMIMGHKHGELSDSEYTSLYIELLDHRNITPLQIIDTYPNNTIFLCYESPTDFCHRHILATWLNEYWNNETKGYYVKVEEWKNLKEINQENQHVFVDSVLDFE